MISLGTGCAASTAQAQIVVESFGAGDPSGASLSGGLELYLGSPGSYYFVEGPSAFYSTFGSIDGDYSFRGTDTPGTIASSYYLFEFYNGGFQGGAVDGSDNFLFADQDNDGTFETLIQFNFSSSGGLVLAAAEETSGADINFSDAVDAITNPIPEPSSLALLALGAMGLATRRNRK